MKVGQISYNKLSNNCDYLQLDICGLNKDEALCKYLKYKEKVPIILHGDWNKKGFSENNLNIRFIEYINIINELKNHTDILGITIHPPSRTKYTLNQFLFYCKKIKEETNIDVFIENRSNKRLLVSTIEEILSVNKDYSMTIDIPQLYITCNYNHNYLLEVLKNLNKSNIQELHLANIMRKDFRTFVGRKLDDGLLNIQQIISIIGTNYYITLEILGGIPTFNNEVLKLKKYIKHV